MSVNRTEITVPLEGRLHNIKLAASAWWRFRLGRFCNGILERARAYERMEGIAGRGRLSESDLAQLRDIQAVQVDHSSENRAKSQITDDNADSNRDIYTQSAAIVRDVLEANDISHVVNVGCRVDVILAYLAAKFPEVRFTSVDVQENLEQHNCWLPKSDNWELRSGYALELFESGALSADMAIFTSTACWFSNAELRNYIGAMKARFLHFNEPFTLPVGQMSFASGPDGIDPSASWISAHTPIMAGGILYFVHNYKRILEDYGYRVTMSKVCPISKQRKHDIRHIVLAEVTK